MNAPDFSRKLRDCIAASGLPMPTDTASKITSLVERLDTLPDMGELVGAMTAETVP